MEQFTISVVRTDGKDYVVDVTWDKMPSRGVSYFEHTLSFMAALADAEILSGLKVSPKVLCGKNAFMFMMNFPGSVCESPSRIVNKTREFLSAPHLDPDTFMVNEEEANSYSCS